MKKNVWIMNHYASGMFYKKNGRHYNFAKYLKHAGYEPVIFSCNVKHKIDNNFANVKDLWTTQIDEAEGIPFVFVKSTNYSDNGIHRIVNMFGFYVNVKKAAKQYAKRFGRPDVIYASSVHPLTLVAGIQLAKYFGVKCICEMRDLWPEAIVVYSKRLTKSNPLVKLFYQGEKWIYTKADALIFTQEGGPDYVREKKWDVEQGGPIDLKKAFHINNGVDLETFDKNVVENVWDDPDLDDSNTFKIIYAGAIRRINNLGIILDTAKEIKNSSIRFLIYGAGDELEKLQKRVEQEHISNVIFKGFVAKSYIPSIVSRADLNIVHWEMSPLVRVGESYNKAFEYFAAGKPVFYTVRPGYSIVEKYQCGRLAEGFSPKELAVGMEAMAEMPEKERTQMCENARKAAKDYDYVTLTRKLIDIIENL